MQGYYYPSNFFWTILHLHYKGLNGPEKILLPFSGAKGGPKKKFKVLLAFTSLNFIYLFLNFAPKFNILVPPSLLPSPGPNILPIKAPTTTQTPHKLKDPINFDQWQTSRGAMGKRKRRWWW
jgi:hypothetical protein